jgi:ParB family chromosome partitioning protein
MTTGKDRPKGLGRGLDALLPVSSPRPAGGPSAAERGLFVCPIERIVPQKGQPRQRFDEQLLSELTASIAEHGLIEPIVVRRAPGGVEKYEIIAGERRWRASQRAGLTEVPVVVKDVSPLAAFELALIENVQRADLNPIELAEALDRLLREHAYTHEKLASTLKKDRSTITNALRLLKLPPRVRGMVIDGRLSEGHARALLGAETEKAMDTVADKIVAGRLSVRQAEELVRGAKAKPAKAGAPEQKSSSVRDLEQRLSRRFGSRVEVNDRKGKGEVIVSYGSLDELDRILALIER